MPIISHNKSTVNYRVSPDSLKFIVKRVLSKDSKTRIGRVVHSSLDKRGSNISFFPPFFQTPATDTLKYAKPGSKEALNYWYKYYYSSHHLVGPIIDTHCDLPLSRFSIIGIEDPFIRRYFEETSETMDILQLFLQAMRNYYVFGETIILGHWDEDLGGFADATVLDPDFTNIYGHPLAINEQFGPAYVVEYVPDPTLKKIASARTDSYSPLAQLQQFIPKDFLDAAASGSKVILDQFSCTPIIRNPRGLDLYSTTSNKIRGTSIIERVLTLLLYEQKMQGAMYSVLDSKISPKVIWKLGKDNWIPTESDYDSFEALIRDAENDPSFELITHDGVSLEVTGTGTQVMNLSNEFDRISNSIITGLMGNKAILTGEGPTYHNASVAMRALLSRYLPLRDRLESMWRNKFWLPSAIANGFFKVKQSDFVHHVRTGRSSYEREYIVPAFLWERKAALLDDPSIRNLLLSARNSGDLPFKTICENIGLDYGEIKANMESEQGTVFDKDARSLRSSLVNKLDIEVPTEKQSDNPATFISYIQSIFKKLFLPASAESAQALESDVAYDDIEELDSTLREGSDQYGGGVRSPSKVRYTEPIEDSFDFPGPGSGSDIEDLPPEPDQLEENLPLSENE